MNAYFFNKSDKVVFPSHKELDDDRIETFFFEKFLIAEDGGVDDVIATGKKLGLLCGCMDGLYKAHGYKCVTEMFVALRGLKDLAKKNRNTILEGVYADMFEFAIDTAVDCFEDGEYDFFVSVYKYARCIIFGCEEYGAAR